MNGKTPRNKHFLDFWQNTICDEPPYCIYIYSFVRFDWVIKRRQRLDMMAPVAENHDLSQKYMVFGLINRFLLNANHEEILYDICFVISNISIPIYVSFSLQILSRILFRPRTMILRQQRNTLLLYFSRNVRLLQ